MHLRRAAREDLPLDQALAAKEKRRAAQWRDMWHYGASAYAADRVQRYFGIVGKDNMRAVLADDLRRAPKETLVNLCHFMGPIYLTSQK